MEQRTNGEPSRFSPSQRHTHVSRKLSYNQQMRTPQHQTICSHVHNVLPYFLQEHCEVLQCVLRQLQADPFISMSGAGSIVPQTCTNVPSSHFQPHSSIRGRRSIVSSSTTERCHRRTCTSTTRRQGLVGDYTPTHPLTTLVIRPTGSPTYHTWHKWTAYRHLLHTAPHEPSRRSACSETQKCDLCTSTCPGCGSSCSSILSWRCSGCLPSTCTRGRQTAPGQPRPRP